MATVVNACIQADNPSEAPSMTPSMTPTKYPTQAPTYQNMNISDCTILLDGQPNNNHEYFDIDFTQPEFDFPNTPAKTDTSVEYSI